MQISLGYILALFLSCFLNSSWALDSEARNVWFIKGENNQYRLQVDLYLSSICPHCHKTDEFFKVLENKDPTAYEVHRYIVNQDKSALAHFSKALQADHSDNFSVPTIFFCNSRWVGFDTAETSGKQLLHALDYCRADIARTGQLNAKTVGILKQWANADFFANSIEGKPSAAAFITGMALNDAINPCSLFSFFALLSFLLMYKERSIQLGLMAFFLAISGVVHHLQQGHTLQFYEMLNWLRIPAACFGFLLIAFVFMIYAKGLTAYRTLTTTLIVGLTAFIVQSYQQTCTPNFALIFDHWLRAENPSQLREGIYSAIYQFFYLLPTLALASLFLYFRDKKLTKYYRFLGYTAGCFLISLAGFLILFPMGLASLSLSLVVLIISSFAAWLITKSKKA